MGEGRRSAPPLLALMRRWLVIRLALGIRMAIRHVPSELNMADGPSRGFHVGPAPETAVKAGRLCPFFGPG
eukprot:5334105-Alexandrium_andersonii.AAC.1